MHRLKQAEDEKKDATWSHNSSSSSWHWHASWWESDFDTRLKDGMTTDSTGQPVPWWLDIYLRKESLTCRELRNLIVNKSVTADGSLLSPTGCVNGIHPAPDIHEHLATANCVHPHAQHEQPGAHYEQWHGHHKAH